MASSNASNGGMSAHDVELCRGFMKTLQSEKNLKYSNVFQYPFDLNHVPGYLDVCPKALDMTTLAQGLEDGRYSSREDFVEDCFLIFENAIKYHSDKDQTKWIVAPAQQMLRIAKREQAKMEKKLAAGGVPAGGGPAAPAKLKLKLSSGGSTAASSSTTSSTDAVGKPKIKIKPPASSTVTAPHGKTPPAALKLSSMASDEPTQPPPNKKPRLKLKLGKPKSDPSMTSPAEAVSPAVPKTPKSTSSAGSGTSKASVKTSGGASRGKELPKGVAVPEPAATNSADVIVKKETTKKATIKKTNSLKAAPKAPGKTAPIKVVTGKAAPAPKQLPAPKAIAPKKDKPMPKAKISLKNKAMGGAAPTPSKDKLTGTLPMTPARSAQCSKVLNGLRRRQATNIIWFEKPVSDKKILSDYRAKIRHPMDLSTMQNNLDRGSYSTVAAFVLDMRRIFGNCLQYNTSIVKDSLRPVAVETSETAEQLMAYFLGKPEIPQQAFPPLLFCWKLCLSVLDTLYNLTNPDDKVPTAYFFLYPVSFYFQGHLPPDYLEKAPRPMDFGTITSKLVEGQYASVDQFEADCLLVIENCMAYNGSKPENKSFCQQATRLNETLQQQLEALNRYIKSPPGLAAKRAAELSVSTCTLPKPPIPLLSSVVQELRDIKYTDKQTKIADSAMGPFEKPVSVVDYPDYMQIVRFPMDLQTVDRKTKSGHYATPEDFEYDMVLMFQNCINYNNFRKIDHLVSMGRFGLSKFRKIFSAKMKAFDDPSSVHVPNPVEMDSSTTVTRKDPPVVATEQGSSKKLKIDTGASRGKTAPRISLNAAVLSQAQKALQNQGRKSPKPPPAVVPKAKSNEPVPLHIAIAQVKERFPLRRAVNSLQSWEAACARFFKELMRHPWISAARPKFIFHVPVPVLFPVGCRLSCSQSLWAALAHSV
jgi:Bromodomain